jgi:hypothetical protein
MLLWLLQPDVQAPGLSEAALKAAIDAALKSSDRILDNGVLGACLILSLLGNVALVWLLVRVQNARVQDGRDVSKVAQDMVTTFSGVDGTLKNLNESSRTQNAALQGVTVTLNTLTMGMLARGVGHDRSTPPPSPGAPR